MDKTVVHKQILESYTRAHREIAEIMNLTTNGMSIWETIEIYKQIDKDVKWLYKRIQYLQLDTETILF